MLPGKRKHFCSGGIYYSTKYHLLFLKTKCCSVVLLYHLDNIQSVNDNRTPPVKVISKQTWNEKSFLFITVFWDVTPHGLVDWKFPNF
jgi:hypothetical protein